jgi:hypothetical protein
MKRFTIAAGLAAAIGLTACGHSSHVTTQSAVTGAPSAGGDVLVTAGTEFRGRLQQEIATDKSHDGDTFTIVQPNATINGHLENISAAGMGKKPTLTIVFDDIKLADGRTAPIDVRLLHVGTFDAKSHHWRTIGMMLGGAVAGHIAAGKHHGGLMGAAGGYLLSQQMKTNIDVKPGTLIAVRFLHDAVAQPTTSPSAQ